MHQVYSTVFCIFQDSFRSFICVDLCLVILGIGTIYERHIDRIIHSLTDTNKRRTEAFGLFTGYRFDFFIYIVDLRSYLIGCHIRHAVVCFGMIGDLHSHIISTLDRFRSFVIYVYSYNKESRFRIILLQNIKHFIGSCSVRSVIKCKCKQFGLIFCIYRNSRNS